MFNSLSLKFMISLYFPRTIYMKYFYLNIYIYIYTFVHLLIHLYTQQTYSQPILIASLCEDIAIGEIQMYRFIHASRPVLYLNILSLDLFENVFIMSSLFFFFLMSSLLNGILAGSRISGRGLFSFSTLTLLIQNFTVYFVTVVKFTIDLIVVYS